MTESTKKISRLLLDGITVDPNPLRPLIDAEVKRLAMSMQQIGMMTPITVRFLENVPSAEFDDSYKIVAGRHRYAAAQSLGWEEIDAIEIECNDVDAKLWEIAENLHRAELTTLQRDEQVAEWIRLTDEKQQEVSGQPAHKPQGGRPRGGVSAATRDLGLERRDATRAIKVASLSDEAKVAAREHGLDDNRTALLEAARESEPAAQVAAIEERAKPATKSFVERRDMRRAEHFDNIIMRIYLACAHTDEIKLTHVTQDQADDAAETILEAEKALSKLRKRITQMREAAR